MHLDKVASGCRFLANGCLSIEGIPVERSDKTGMAKVSEPFLLEQKG